MRVAFAGTPEFAARSLQALLEAGFELPLVLTQPDRPAGRGLRLQPSPVKQLALAHGIPVAQPQGLRLDGRHADEARAAQAALQAAAPDLMVVAAYGLILPHWALNLPARGCLNVHASLLPRWRGAAPIHRAIEAGDAQTGITLMQMDEGLDTGDMLAVARQPILAGDCTGTLHDRLAQQGGELLVHCLREMAAGRAPVPQAQPEEGVCYAHKIAKAEAAIDWREPAEVIERRLRAFDPFPGAQTLAGDEAIKVWSARVIEPQALPDAACPPGAVVDAGPTVQTGQGRLQLLSLQRAGGRRLPAADFQRGVALLPGQRLG